MAGDHPRRSRRLGPPRPNGATAIALFRYATLVRYYVYANPMSDATTRRRNDGEIRAAVQDLQERVEALERAPAPVPHQRSARAPDRSLLDTVSALAEAHADDASPAGTIAYAGVAR